MKHYAHGSWSCARDSSAKKDRCRPVKQAREHGRRIQKSVNGHEDTLTFMQKSVQR